jgi:hypothetical protein
MAEHVRAPRRRIHQLRDDRLVGCDMRSRIGKSYTSAFIASLREFPDADAAKVAEVARLRTIAALAQQAALTGSGTADAALRATSAADRCARDLGGKS